MNYSQTLEYLYNQLPMFQRVGGAAYKADLGNTIALTELLGHPEKKIRSVHVAGTNGKGSLSHMLASILQDTGYKTGLYTSPHLKDFRERIRINGKMVPKGFVTQFVGRHKKDFEQIQPSFFEYTAVMAFEYFANEEVDIAIMETGMGGRLDSTNVILPILSVITNISLDHTAFLGNTLAEIAREKAGIIKPGIPVIVGETQEETTTTFKQIAEKGSSPIIFADRDFTAEKSNPGQADHYLALDIKRDKKILLKGLKCPLKGNYQEKNIVTLFAAIDVLRQQSFHLSDENIRNGLEHVVRNTGLRGRWQQLGTNPLIICDIGHNEAGIQNILDQLEEEKFSELHWVFGMVNDKETGAILGMLPKSARYYYCKPDIPRGLEASELKRKAEEFRLKGEVYSSVREAYQEALKNAHAEDMVFVGGSTFVVAEIL